MNGWRFLWEGGWGPGDLLPGLYLALLAGLLGWVLRRWFDPVPRRVWGVAGLVLMALLGPVLVGGQVLVPTEILSRVTPFERLERPPERANRLQLDLVSQITPSLALTRRAVREGHWPLWNAYSGAGLPLMGDPQSQPFQPLVLAAYPLPLPRAMGVTAGLRILLALVFLFLLLRRLGISEVPALAGSLTFSLGGFLLLWLGWPIANSAAWLPVVLYGVLLVEERGAGRDVLLLALAVFGVLLSGQPETAVNVLLVGAAFGLARLLGRRPSAPASVRPELWRTLGRWGLAALLAGLAAAPVLLPAADYLPQTHRDTRIERRNARDASEGWLQGWGTAEERAKSWLGAARRILPAAAPNAFGNNRFGHYWGQFNVNEDAGAFAGTAALLAALLAAVPGLVPGARRFPQERFWLGLGAVSLVVLFRPPGLVRLVVALPLLGKSATYHQRAVLFLGLSIAVLAACTWERWRTAETQRPRRARLAWLLAVALGSAALAALIAWIYLDFGTPPPSIPARSLRALRLGTLALQLGTLAAAALLLAGRFSRWRAWALTGVVTAELMWILGAANPGQPARLFYPVTPPLAFLQERLGADPAWSRIVALGPDLQPNSAALYGLADVRTTNPLRPFQVALVTRPVSASLLEVNDAFVTADHTVYDLLGARYLLTARRAAPPRPWRRVFRHPAGWVWERPSALPRLFLPASARVVPPATWRPSVWEPFVTGRRDFGARSLLEGDRVGRSGVWRAGSGDGTLRPLRLAPAHLRLEARLAGPRPLASSVYQDGNWRLLRDGRPFPTVRANGPFVAAWLPAGSSRLDLVYRPRTLLPGCLLAALGVGLGLAGLVPRPRSRSGAQLGTSGQTGPSW